MGTVASPAGSGAAHCRRKAGKDCGVDVVVPDRVMLEEELELSGNETELELEVSWPTKAARSKQPKGRRR